MRVFTGAGQGLLLGFDLLHEVGAGIVVELRSLRVELLLHAVQLIADAFKLGTLGLKFLSQGFEVALAFVGGDDGGLHVNDADLGAGGGGRGGGGLGHRQRRQHRGGQK